MDIAEDTWAVIDWAAVELSENPRAELLALRARQLERRTEDLQTAAEMLKKSRESNKAYFDDHRRRRPERPHTEIKEGDYVLLHDTRLDQSHSHKLRDRWNGPYLVVDASRKEDRGTYQLAELDGVVMKGYFPGDRVKKFTKRTE